METHRSYDKLDVRSIILTLVHLLVFCVNCLLMHTYLLTYLLHGAESFLRS